MERFRVAQDDREPRGGSVRSLMELIASYMLSAE